jgi:hypothetical protein
MACNNFLNAHRMPRLAEHFEDRVEVHYIPSTEIKE